MANKKENIKNLVKRMFLSISIMSFFVSAGVDNASAMEQNSIFGAAHKRKSDNSQQNTAPISAPMATTLAANSSRQNITPVFAPVSATPTKQLNSNYGRDESVLEFEQNINKEVVSKILDDTQKKSGKDKNESSESDSSNSSGSSFDEIMNVSFSLTVPEPKKETPASNKINAKKDKDVLLFLNGVTSVNDIPLCMYNVLISRIDDFFYTKIPLNDKVIRTILRIWGVDHKILSEPEDSIPIILRSIREILSEALLNCLGDK